MGRLAYVPQSDNFQLSLDFYVRRHIVDNRFRFTAVIPHGPSNHIVVQVYISCDVSTSNVISSSCCRGKLVAVFIFRCRELAILYSLYVWTRRLASHPTLRVIRDMQLRVEFVLRYIRNSVDRIAAVNAVSAPLKRAVSAQFAINPRRPRANPSFI